MPEPREHVDAEWRALVGERLAAEGLRPSEHADATEEIAQHLTQLHAARLREGASDPEARASVARELAGLAPLARVVERRTRRRSRPAWPTSVGLQGLWQDLRLACRLVRARPGFSTVAILTLAVGIGASTAVYGVFDAMLLRPLPFPDPDRLVLVWESDTDTPGSASIVAAPNYLDWASTARSFTAMAMWEFVTYNIAAGAEPEQTPAARATASLFQTLGVLPAMGRTFTASEEPPGHHVVVIGDGVWRTQFGGDPRVIGRTLRLNGLPHEVIGVMPPGFEFPREGTGVWVPIGLTPQDAERGAHSFFVAARLRPDVSIEEARVEMDGVGRRLAERYPDTNRGETVTVTRMSEYGITQLRPMLTAVLGAVLLVLLIACVNVANLQLGHAVARRREFVVRMALGAGLGRLTRQLVAEGVVLAVCAGSAGLVFAWLAIQSADLMLTPGFRRLPLRGEMALGIDARVVWFAVLCSAASVLLFGLAPLAGLRRSEPHVLLRAGDRAATGATTGARRALVAGEVALAVVILCGAGLMFQSLTRLLRVEPGLDPTSVLTLVVSLPQPDTYGPPVRAGFCGDLAREAGSVPGVREVSAVSHLPFSGANASRGLSIEGRPAAAPGEGPTANYRVVCPAYFQALGIPLPSGREFDARDTRESEPVAIVNRTMAEQYWPGISPVGRRFKLGGLDTDNPWLTVVGVSGDVRHFGLDTAPRREFFRPYDQSAWPVMTVVAQTTVEPLTVQRSMRLALQRVEPDLPAAHPRSMRQVMDESEGWRHTPLRLLGVFATIGLTLAGIGVYGVLAYFVSQRSRELGVRTALGASHLSIAGLVVRQSLLPIAAGVATGVLVSFASGRLLSGILYEVRPGDPGITTVIALLVTAVACLAAVLPAIRAATVDPVKVLHEE